MPRKLLFGMLKGAGPKRLNFAKAIPLVTIRPLCTSGTFLATPKLTETAELL